MASRFPGKKGSKGPPSPPLATVSPVPAAARRKAGSLAREWLVIPAAGTPYQEEVGKQSLMRRTGLPARDLRMLDPLLSYPSTILARERAIVVDLEHIRAIITAGDVLIPRSTDPLVEALVHDLQSRVPDYPKSPPPKDVEDGVPAYNGSPREAKGNIHQGQGASKSWKSSNELQESCPRNKLEGTNLPFEFRALEVCLESACKGLESETDALEKEAYPVLDELTSRISTLNLERARQIKSRLVAISGRVQKVGIEIEHLLDNDMGMAMMHLSQKILHKALEESSRFELYNDAIELDNEMDEEPNYEPYNSDLGIGSFKPDVNELEMLLEAYFVQIEGMLSKLNTLTEYVADTEDYINIMLDDKQNQLLQMGVMLSTATLFSTVAVLVANIMGMNIRIPLFDNGTYRQYWETFGYSIGGCITLFILTIWGLRRSGLLQ